MRVKVDDVKMLLSWANPFMLRNELGCLMKFETTQQAYFYVLKKLYELAPVGFVDVVLMMMDLQGLTVNEACNICPEKQYAYIEWWNLESERTQFKLKYVLRLLLKPAELYLDESVFSEALEAFNKLFGGAMSEELNKHNLHIQTPI